MPITALGISVDTELHVLQRQVTAVRLCTVDRLLTMD